MELEKLENPDIRHLSDMGSVVFDKEWLKSAPDRDMYYMYRGLKHQDSLRYDITVIPPFLMGTEYAKTLGHFHEVGSKEMYIVLEGEALFIFQKGKDAVEKFIAVKAKKGDVAIVPEGYAHVTVNPSQTETLKMANWVNSGYTFDYKSVTDKGGLCYFYTQTGWIKNNNYKSIPEITFEEPLKEIPQNLDFLK